MADHGKILDYGGDDLKVRTITTGSSKPNTNLTVGTAGSILSTAPTAGIGYTTGAGGAVTQLTSRSTGVTLNTITGAITLVSATPTAALAGTQTFTVTNSAVAATDTVVVSQKSGTDTYVINVTNVAAGSFKITFFTHSGTTAEQPVFNFAVIKGSAS